MRLATIHALIPVLCAALLPACNNDGGRGDDGACGSGLLVGDLIITEIMANPPGADEGQEWFEFYNASGLQLDLTGLTLALAKADGSGGKEHQVAGLVVEDGQYVVVGDLLNEADILPSHVIYGYGNDLGGMNNTAGRLQVACGTDIIDEAFYDAPSDGASRGFDGTRAPDASGNDDLLAWCDAVTAFGDEGFATPGEENDACFGAAPTVCEEDGSERDVVPPTRGDIIITEVMPNPSAVGDAEGEWFEVYVANAVDLNGLGIGKPGEEESEDILGDTACISVAGGSYLVFARQTDAGVNGGLPRVDHPFSFAMSNSNAGLELRWGDAILDEFTWSSSHDGASTNLDPDRFDPGENDDEGNWCEATDPYGDGDLGTPGEPNIECAIAPPDGQCVDNGTLRPIVAPSPGDLVITEFMPNPAVVGDTEGEWFELRANAAFDLNGLEMGREDVEDAIEVEDCISMSAGDYVVIAKNDDMATNGGIPNVAATFSFSLVNSDGRLFVAMGGTVLDEVAWTSSTSGAATSLDGGLSAPADNDDEANMCDAVDVYGDGDLGTPGAANPACGGTPDGMCDDAGNMRATVAPTLGDVVITEMMPDPTLVADGVGEWFEVLVTADVDLNGLQMGRIGANPSTTLPGGGTCLAVTAGTRVVFAKNSDVNVNGGLDDVFAEMGSLNLVQSNGDIAIGYGGTVLDEVTWTSTSAGASHNLDPGSENETANDIEANFCAATTTYNVDDVGTPTDAGTPGMPNDTCS